MKTNNVLKKSLLSSVLFIILVVIVFYFIFKDLAFKDILFLIRKANKFYLLLGVLVMFSYNILEALNLKIILTSLGDKPRFINCYKYAIGSFFTASIIFFCF